MAEDDPGDGLAFDVAERILLDLREVAYLGLCELDVRALARVHPLMAGVDRGPAQAEFDRRPAVEPLGVLADRSIAARLDVAENTLDGPAHLRVGVGPGVVADPGLEVAGHGTLLPVGLECGAS